MALTKFTWNNGTEDSPIILTDDQINALVRAGKKEGLTTDIGGWIQPQSGFIKKYLKYSIEDTFGGKLKVKGTEQPDAFIINVSQQSIKEGQSSVIRSGADPSNPNSSAIPVEYLQFVLEHEITIISGSITEDTIKSRFTVDGDTLKCANPQENAEWIDNVTIKAYPIYEDVNNSDNYSSAIVQVLAKPITSFSIDIPDEVPTNGRVVLNYVPMPADSTKLAGASYIPHTMTGGDYAGGVTANGIYIAPAEAGKGRIDVDLYLFPQGTGIGSYFTSASKEFTIFTLKPSVIIIDQTIYATPSTPDFIGGEIGMGKDPQSNVIAWIRSESHLYLGKWNRFPQGSHDENMQLKQLSDTDKTKFKNGVAAVINGDVTAADPVIKDVWLKLPTFYYKMTERNDEIYKIAFAKEAPVGETGWQMWNTDTLIGVYKAVSLNNMLYSISGNKPSVGITQTTFKSMARARGNGFRLVTYEAHKVMALLFYAWYGYADSQSQCGYGTENRITVDGITYYYPKVNGLCDSYGMSDTNNITGNGATEPDESQIQAGQGSDIKSINFWGLENWWGDLCEYCDDIYTVSKEDMVKVLNTEGSKIINVDGVDTPCTASDVQNMGDIRCLRKVDYRGDVIKYYIIGRAISGSIIRQFTLGEECDVMPKVIGGDSSKFYTDYGSVYAGSGCGLTRSYYSAHVYGGVGCFTTHHGTYAYVGSRLLYEGSSVILRDDEDFS